MSEQKPLSKQTREELVATANDLDLAVAADATKAQIIEQIEAVPATTPVDPDADVIVATDDTLTGDPDGGFDDGGQETHYEQDVTAPDESSGLVTITRDITERAANGDWVDPFSGLRVHEGSLACTQSGSVRDEDFTAATVQVTAERAAELGA